MSNGAGADGGVLLPEEAELRTERLVLRRWRQEDRAPFAEMNADAEVMRHFPSTLTREASDALVEQVERHFRSHGFGFWAVETREGAPFIGVVGLGVVTFEAPFTPSVEFAWRLAREHWGKGYATEAARAAMAYGFGALGLDEIVAFTTPANTASRRVMEKLGMTRDPREDFDHPNLAAGHPLRRHVLYRARREARR
jgi:RimJ/RimL family protein N-acetyltransferase